MSLEAFIWAAQLPVDVCDATSYRVLIVLANHAHSDGSNAWRSKQGIAQTLRCSERTVQRSLASLRARGLIKPGDQRLVDQIRADRRPVVYDLNLAFDLVHTAVQPLEGGDIRVPPHGETAVSGETDSGLTGRQLVSHRTVLNPSRESSPGDHKEGVTSVSPTCGHELIDERHCVFGCHPSELVDA